MAGLLLLVLQAINLLVNLITETPGKNESEMDMVIKRKLSYISPIKWHREDTFTQKIYSTWGDLSPIQSGLNTLVDITSNRFYCYYAGYNTTTAPGEAW